MRIINIYDNEGKDIGVAIIPCGYNEERQKINMRAKTVIDERPRSGSTCVDLIPPAHGSTQGIQVVEDRGGRKPLGLNLGC